MATSDKLQLFLSTKAWASTTPPL
ncbi:hypothetical protein CCACVL1_27957 [Corchorus capsularis]|uniref:Uncharacterized protein n=1 Tax=Corchorus capsularis TaxID=210143 RepID=A0A1R3G851_COCAP|nr:hypothetical protein CCACVL1_27957 [Corchorus capsularis]